MKKVLLLTAFCCITFLNASALKKIAIAIGEWTYQWTSTCGITHYTSFTGDWSPVQMANWISYKNLSECGVRPNVNLELAPDML